LNAATKLTIEFWMKPINVADVQVLISKWNYYTDGSWGFQMGSPIDTDEIGVFILESPTDPGNQYGKTTDANFVGGDWYYITMVYDGDRANNVDRLKIYVDGTQKLLTFTGTIPSSLVNSAAPVRIGTIGGLEDRYFNGAIDEAAVYSRALTAEEVKAHYDANKAKFIEWVGGKYGYALRFDGVDDYVNITKKFAGPQYYTIESWVKPEWEGSCEQEIFDKVEWLNLRIDNINVTAGDISTSNITLVHNRGISEVYLRHWPEDLRISKSWVHIAGTFDLDNKARLYINGVLSQEIQNISTNDDSSNYAMMGDFPGDTSLIHNDCRNNINFNGLIDEVRILNIARPMG